MGLFLVVGVAMVPEAFLERLEPMHLVSDFIKESYSTGNTTYIHVRFQWKN